MIDTQYLRKNLDYIKKIISSGRGNPKKADIDKWIELDNQRSKLIQEIESKRSKRNELSKNTNEKPSSETITTVKNLKIEIETLESDLNKVENMWQEILDFIPNIPISEIAMPFGKEEADNPIDKLWVPNKGYVIDEKQGEQTFTLKIFDQTLVDNRSIHWDKDLKNPLHHIEIGTKLNMFDLEQGAKVSGTRFKYLVNDGALLEHSLFMLMSKKLREEGFTPIIPPLLVKHRSLYGTSHFPEGLDQVYSLEMDERFEENDSKRFLVGSSEPANFSYFIDRTLEEENLPQLIFAYTPCFRSEVGSWGRDVKGIKRVHQFAKIEINAVCLPEQSDGIFKKFLTINEWLFQQLEIPYRLTRKCTSDAGYHASAEQIDPEVWLPAQQEWMEVGTDTNATDFQARRMNIKVRRKNGEKEYVHTVNDTATAIERTIIAIIDHYQQSDGTVKIPKILVPYMGKDFIR